MNPVTDVLCILLSIYYFILFARVILSWVPAPPEGLRPVVAFVFAVTEPVMQRIRPLLPPLRMGAVALDLSILLVFFILVAVRYAFC